MECVLQSESSRLSFATHPWKIRLYCRVDMCWLVPIPDRNKKSLLCKLPRFINVVTASLVPLVISNWTGLPVFCCNTVALLETELPYATSDTLSFTRSQPRSLLSRAILNGAKSRVLPSSSSLIRIPQIWDIWSGLFGLRYGLCSTMKCSDSNLLQWEIWVWLSLMSEKRTSRSEKWLRNYKNITRTLDLIFR